MPLYSATSPAVPPPGEGRPGGGPKPRCSIATGFALALLLAGCSDTPTGPPPVATARGAQLFKERCAPCHPDGGNVLNPRKTLHGGVLADNGVAAPDRIVKKMRNPGPGMTRFDAATIPDTDARLIADYILATFR